MSGKMVPFVYKNPRFELEIQHAYKHADELQFGLERDAFRLAMPHTKVYGPRDEANGRRALKITMPGHQKLEVIRLGLDYWYEVKVEQSIQRVQALSRIMQTQFEVDEQEE